MRAVEFVIQIGGYRGGRTRGLLVCTGSCESMRCFGMKREVMGSFLFMGDFNGRCSPLEGGDCAVSDGFGGRAVAADF